MPGYGAQGGKAEDVAKSFNQDGLGAIVKRLEIYYVRLPEKRGELGEAARAEAIRMRDDIVAAIQ